MPISFLDESSNCAPTPTQKGNKRALVIDLISDSDDDDEAITQSSSKKMALSTPTSTKPQASAISSTSDSPELMIIDLE